MVADLHLHRAMAPELRPRGFLTASKILQGGCVATTKRGGAATQGWGQQAGYDGNVAAATAWRACVAWVASHERRPGLA